ncbi:MAG: hypothetical protein ABH881_01520 [bacterium]
MPRAVSESRAREIDPLFLFLAEVEISPNMSSFADDVYFVEDGAEVKISCLEDGFLSQFPDNDNRSRMMLSYGELWEPSKDGLIIAKLGGEKKVRTTLPELWGVLKKQPNLEEGALSLWSANIFYILNNKGILCPVIVDQKYGGWRISVRSVKDSYEWYEDSRVFCSAEGGW